MKKAIKIHLAVLGVTILYTISPLLAVFGSLGLAQIAGCDGVNEGSKPNCTIEAVEDIVYSGFVMGWFGLITLPTGVPLTLILLVTLPIHYLIVWKKKD